MRAPDSNASRPDTVVAALIYLMTHYVHTGCPRLALCVSRHMQCLAAHPDASPVLRDICAGLHGAWQAIVASNHRLRHGANRLNEAGSSAQFLTDP